MRAISVTFELSEEILPEVRWAWDLFCTHFGIPYRIEKERDSELHITMEGADKGELRVSERFLEIIKNKKFEHKEVFPEEPVIRCKDGKKDILGTCFYMVNGLQERSEASYDHDLLGRFKAEASYQHRFGLFEEDLVSELFEELYDMLGEGLLGKKPSREGSKVFLTHDIDRIVQGDLREAYWKMKRGRIGPALRSLSRRITGDHEWDNTREILDIHKERGIRSTYFWLTEKGRDANGVLNADHSVEKPRYKNHMRVIEEASSSNGLHKSSFGTSVEEELAKLPEALPINRNHYLMMRIPEHYHRMEDAGILLDSSLGFSDAIGFRNSYGRPFHPFDDRKRKKMRLLEVPLNLMDVTLFSHYEAPEEKADEFIQSNKCGKVITFLWHNNSFSHERFREMRALYLRLLDRMEEEGLKVTSPEELLEASSSLPTK